MQVYAPDLRAEFEKTRRSARVFSAGRSAVAEGLNEAMERLEQRSGPAPPDHGGMARFQAAQPGCPEPSRTGDARPRAVGASPPEGPGAAPKVRKGTSTHPLLASATPQSSERGPH